MGLHFDCREGGGCQRKVAVGALILSLAAWCLQLSGVASLQAACHENFNMEDNDLTLIGEFLEVAKANGVRYDKALADIAKLPAAMQTAGMAMLDKETQATMITDYPNLLRSMATLAHRSAAGVFTLTPDQNCNDYYRYQWLNVFFQLVMLVVAFASLFTGILHVARVAICCFLSIATMLSLENVHTFFYLKNYYAPEPSLTRGRVFLVGCIITVIANVILTIVLGVHNEMAPMRDEPYPFPIAPMKVADAPKDGEVSNDSSSCDRDTAPNSTLPV
eukprot:gene6697-3367_t